MPSHDVLFDLTEFLHDPQRSGIQRVCHEIVAHWPSHSRLIPACVDERSRLIELPPDVLDLYRLFFSATPEQLPSLRDRLRVASYRKKSVVSRRRFRAFRGLLNATVFTLPHQTNYYSWAMKHGLGERIFFFVHDMLPWVQPELFIADFGVNLFPYLRCLRESSNLSFNSNQTRDDTLHRVLRDGRAPGPVFPLGAESLGEARPSLNPDRRLFTVVGTIEPRKNHRAVLDAFTLLWKEGLDVELAFAGKLGWAAEEERQEILRLAKTESRFHFLDSLGDAEMALAIQASRATIYPAFFEGYGLPPVESLALGVPVIVTGSLPSIAMLSNEGQLRLPSPTAENVGQAVRLMLDADFATRKVEEIRRLRLPSWRAMTEGLADWIEYPNAVGNVPVVTRLPEPLARAG